MADTIIGALNELNTATQQYHDSSSMGPDKVGAYMAEINKKIESNPSAVNITQIAKEVIEKTTAVREYWENAFVPAMRDMGGMKPEEIKQEFLTRAATEGTIEHKIASGTAEVSEIQEAGRALVKDRNTKMAALAEDYYHEVIKDLTDRQHHGISDAEEILRNRKKELNTFENKIESGVASDDEIRRAITALKAQNKLSQHAEAHIEEVGGSSATVAVTTTAKGKPAAEVDANTLQGRSANAAKNGEILAYATNQQGKRTEVNVKPGFGSDPNDNVKLAEFRDVGSSVVFRDPGNVDHVIHMIVGEDGKSLTRRSEEDRMTATVDQGLKARSSRPAVEGSIGTVTFRDDANKEHRYEVTVEKDGKWKLHTDQVGGGKEAVMGDRSMQIVGTFVAKNAAQGDPNAIQYLVVDKENHLWKSAPPETPNVKAAPVPGAPRL